MSQNTKTYLYAHIQDLQFADEECVLGYGNKKDYGLKEDEDDGGNNKCE